MQKFRWKKFSLSVAVPGVNFPPMHAYCRSTTVPVDVDDLEDSVRIARDENGKNIYVDANLSYQEWYKKYVETNPRYLLKEKKWKNRNSDKTQFEKYKSLGYDGVKSFEKFQDIKYNNTKEWDMVKGYVGIVQRGEISPLVGYNNFKEYHKNLENKLIGLKFNDGLEVKGISCHFTSRAIGTHDWVSPSNSKEIMKRLNHKHVHTDDLIKCINDGEKIHNRKNSSTFRQWDDCDVTMNPITGVLIQCNPC